MTEFPAQPPAYPTYPTAAPMRGTQPLNGLGAAVSILLAIAGVVSVGAAFALFDRMGAMSDYATDSANDSATLSDLADADGLVLGSQIGFLIAVVATGAVFIVWQHRYASNAETLRGRLSLGPAWAIAGWFIPLGNLVLPYLQLNQSAKATGPAPGILLGWICAYDAAFVISISARIVRGSPADYTDRDTAITAFTAGDRIAAIGMLGYFAAALLAILMVRSLNAHQQRAVDALLEAQGWRR